MKLVILYFVLALCSVFCLNAVSFSTGYVVDNKNDTIYGLLKIGSNSFNVHECVLKDSVTQTEHIYSPEEINSYRFLNGKYYVSKLLALDESPKKVFMEYLVKGIVDVYYYSDKLDGRYFVDKGDGVLLELKNTKYLVQEENKTYQRNRNEYVILLGPIFQDSPKTCDELMRSQLDYKSLIRLVVDYHLDKCTSDQCVVYEKKLKSEKLHFGIIVGLNSVSLSKGSDAEGEEYFRNLQLNSIIYPSFGCFVEQKFPYINNDLLYARYEASFYEENHSGVTYSQTEYSSITNEVKDSKFNLKNTLLVKYDLSRGRFRPVVQMGFFGKMALSSKFERRRSMRFNNSDNDYIASYTGSSPFLKDEIGPVAGLGLKYKITEKQVLLVDLRYNWSMGVGSDNHFRTNLFSLNMSMQLF
jgi:outer membrane protein W